MCQSHMCGPGMNCGHGVKVWTKTDQLQALDKYEQELKDELKEIEKARTVLAEEK